MTNSVEETKPNDISISLREALQIPALAALGYSTRAQIFAVLATSSKPMRSDEINAKFEMPFHTSNIARHLKILLDAECIQKQYPGPRYSVDPSVIQKFQWIFHAMEQTHSAHAVASQS